MWECVERLNIFIIPLQKNSCYTLYMEAFTINQPLKWRDYMLLEDLIHRFTSEKNQAPLHANDLLDYVQKQYIHREISIVEYKKLFCELDKRQAEKPQSYTMRIDQTHLQSINLPG